MELVRHYSCAIIFSTASAHLAALLYGWWWSATGSKQHIPLLRKRDNLKAMCHPCASWVPSTPLSLQCSAATGSQPSWLLCAHLLQTSTSSLFAPKLLLIIKQPFNFLALTNASDFCFCFTVSGMNKTNQGM